MMKATVFAMPARFAVMLLILCNSALCPRIRFEKVDQYQGFPSDSVNAIFQDSYGFIWVGCDEGVFRYDGHSFRLFRPSPDNTPGARFSFSVSSIVQDLQGGYWIGTFGSGLFYLDPKSETIREVAYLPPSQAGQSFLIYKLLRDTNGSIWITSWGFGISRFDPAEKRFSHYPAESGADNPIASSYLRPICESNDGSLWFGSGGGQIYRFDSVSQRFTRFQLHQDDDETQALQDIVFSLYSDSEDDLWIGTLNSGLWHCRYRDQRLLVIGHHQTGNQPGMLGDNHIRDLLETNQLPGQIWICTDYGLYLFDKKKNVFTRFLADPNDSFSLSRNYLSCIFEDRTGLLWLGTINGALMKFSPHTSSMVTQVPRLLGEKRSHSEVTSLLWLANSRIVLGGLASTLTLTSYNDGILNGEQIQLSGNDLNSNRILAIAADPENPDTLLIGTSWSGAKKISLQADRQSFSAQQAVSKQYKFDSANTINDILTFARNEVWYATNAGLFMIRNGKIMQYKRSNTDALLPHDRIIRLFHDGSGLVWIGTQTGLSLYSTKAESFMPLDDRLQTLQSIKTAVRAFHKSASGEMWIGTDAGLIGIPKALDREILRLDHELGLESDRILTIQSDKTGHIWMGTAHGLSRYDPISKRIFNYDLYNGLDNHRLICSHYDAEQDLMFFGGSNGLTVFQPSLIRPAPYPPTIQFTGFETIDKQNDTPIPLPLDKPSHLTERISLKEGLPLFIHFSAMDFGAPRKNQYQYRMIGLQEQWRYTTSGKQTASFYYLSPGKYRFQVKGSNSDGVWNAQGISLEIEIRAPWWKSPLFLITAALLILGSSVFIYRNRLHIVTFRKNEREKLQIFFDAHSISQREVEIIELIIAGHSNKEIEDILFISLPTVKSHIYHIFKKLGVSSRSQLLALINRFKGIGDSK